MKKLITFLILIGFSHIIYADSIANKPAKQTSNLAIETDIASGGDMLLNLIVYAPKYELGIYYGSSKIINSDTNTKYFAPGMFGGIRRSITDSTAFGLCLDVSSKFGKINDENIKAYYGIGIFVTLEQMLTNRVMLTAWYDPYFYTHEKIGNTITNSHDFGSGGIGVAYLF